MIPNRLARWLSDEVHGGVLLLVAALAAIGWANSPWAASYQALSETRLGWAGLHLELTVAHWASDGLLAVFFFVVGVELKHELVAGSLRQVRQAAVPVLAAVGGMAAPALLFTVVVLLAGDGPALHGWAIPTATDIAFALAVLAVFGRGLPRALRIFLLTLAVVDDLLAIVVIAIAYTDHIDAVMLAGAVASVALFGVLARLRRTGWWLLAPTAVLAWAFMHASGVHATVAAVLCGLLVPAVARHGEDAPRTHRYDDALRPLSTGVALPVFAFFAAGVSLTGTGEGAGTLTQPVFWAVLIGLLAGKVLGVLGTAALVTRFTPLRLPDAIGLRDLLPVGFLTGIGFTVALLIAELSFDDGAHQDAAKVGILTASVLAGVLGAVLLRWDARRGRDADMNRDDVPDSDTRVID